MEEQHLLDGRVLLDGLDDGQRSRVRDRVEGEIDFHHRLVLGQALGKHLDLRIWASTLANSPGTTQPSQKEQRTRKLVARQDEVLDNRVGL